VVEGFSAAHPTFSLSLNPLKNLVQICPDGFRPDSEHGYASSLQPRRPASVMQHPIRMIMAHPIHLNCQLRLGAVEVEDVNADRVLSPELQSGQGLTSQPRPEPRFRWRQGAPQDARTRYGSLCGQEPLRRSPSGPRHLPVAAQRGEDMNVYALLDCKEYIPSRALRPACPRHKSRAGL